MSDGNIVGSIDVAEIALTLFFLFFVGLIFWLRREDRREGYPLEDEMRGIVDMPGGPLADAAPKFFKLPFDRGTVAVPSKRTEDREPVNIAAERIEPFAGSPYAPTGNPLVDGIGPAAYANRAKYPDLDAHGAPRIVPMASDADFDVVMLPFPGVLHDPRGMPVIAADGKTAGTVVDMWVDRMESVVRYFSVDIGTKTVLVPMTMSRVWEGKVYCDAINAADYAQVPALESETQITRYEEERIVAYFGGGYLYANREREEPCL